MKTKQEIEKQLDSNKQYLEKYGNENWMKSTDVKQLLENQISILEWVLDIEEYDPEA